MISGIINIYKEKGYTSHDVVAKMRGILKQKKIGHSGTLDPEAEGVLPVCLGSGTKLCDMLTDKSKTYETTLLLGKTTDTQDITGAVLAQKKVEVPVSEVEQAILTFVGNYDQIPPMYSALKVQGKKLYELAREGKTVERQPRPVQIYDIVIKKVELPEIVMSVSCSKGTYIRTLCHDIGEKLGCGGCMKTLLRTRVGLFEVSDSLTLTQVEEAMKENRLGEIVVPVDRMFPELPRVHVTQEGQRFLDNGNPLSADQLAEKVDPKQTKACRVYDTEDHFRAIYQWKERMRKYAPEKMFPES